MARAFELLRGELREVGDAIDGGASRSALDAGREGLAQQPRAGGVGDRTGKGERRFAARGSADKEHRRFAGAQRGGDRGDRAVVGGRAPRRALRPYGLAAFAPRDVGGEHEGRDLAGRAERGRDGVGRVAADLAGLGRAADEARHVAGDRLDVRLELRVVLIVIRRVVTHDVDDGCLALARVVQVGEPVAEPRSEVEQGGGRTIGHAPVSVGGSGGDPLEECEHAVHLGHGVERGNEVHLGCAGVHEARVDATRDQRADERLRAVHREPFIL